MFRCTAIRGGRFATADITYLDVRLDQGTIMPGSVGHVLERPGVSLKILSVAIVNVLEDPTVLTLSISAPEVSLEELIGKTIEGD